MRRVSVWQWRVRPVTITLPTSPTNCQVTTADGRRALNVPFRVTPNNLAYIQSSNLEDKSEEAWRPDGTAGLALTLMRNGYVTLTLQDLTQVTALSYIVFGNQDGHCLIARDDSSKRAVFVYV